MRKIVFRGKSEYGWSYGYYCSCIENGIAKHYIFSTQHTEYFHIDPKTIGQFTGLHDKNGKEIYEGDILEYKSPHEDYTIVQWVYYSDKYAAFASLDLDEHDYDELELFSSEFCRSTDFFKNITVIGNVHDDQQLL